MGIGLSWNCVLGRSNGPLIGYPCNKSSNEMILYTNVRVNPLALPWGRISRLCSGVRISNHVYKGMLEYVY